MVSHFHGTHAHSRYLDIRASFVVGNSAVRWNFLGAESNLSGGDNVTQSNSATHAIAVKLKLTKLDVAFEIRLVQGDLSIGILSKSPVPLLPTPAYISLAMAIETIGP